MFKLPNTSSAGSDPPAFSARCHTRCVAASASAITFTIPTAASTFGATSPEQWLHHNNKFNAGQWNYDHACHSHSVNSWSFAVNKCLESSVTSRDPLFKAERSFNAYYDFNDDFSVSASNNSNSNYLGSGLSAGICSSF